MKFLLINDFFVQGGTEVQTKREIKNLHEHGHQTFLITFDRELKEGLISESHYNFKLGKNVISKFFDKFFVNRFVRRKFISVVSGFKPDFIHINNVFACPKLVYSVVKDYKAIQTVRDYWAVCPKSTCIKSDFNECKGYVYSDCGKCNKGIKAKIKNKLFMQLIKAKHKSIKEFVCPSEALTQKCSENGYKIECINNPFDFEKSYFNYKTFGDEKIYLYYGVISEIKGVFKLIDAFNIFCKDKANVKLRFIGKIDRADEAKFKEQIKLNSKFEYLGFMKNDDILKDFGSVYCTVVPSLWLENYPNTVLESMANYTLVIGSDRGGIAGMIANNDLLFDILDIDDLVKKLEYTYALSEEEYLEIVAKNYNRVRDNNTLENYYEKLLKVCEKL